MFKYHEHTVTCIYYVRKYVTFKVGWSFIHVSRRICHTIPLQIIMRWKFNHSREANNGWSLISLCACLLREFRLWLLPTPAHAYLGLFKTHRSHLWFLLSVDFSYSFVFWGKTVWSTVWNCIHTTTDHDFWFSASTTTSKEQYLCNTIHMVWTRPWNTYSDILQRWCPLGVIP